MEVAFTEKNVGGTRFEEMTRSSIWPQLLKMSLDTQEEISRRQSVNRGHVLG